MLTKSHRVEGTPNPRADCYDGAIMVDIDLSILGAKPDVFDAYDTTIAAEYDWVEYETYRNGRAEFVQSMLDRPHIFLTMAFRQRYEEQARDNLERCLRGLKG